jgi:hypothetical protein
MQLRLLAASSNSSGSVEAPAMQDLGRFLIVAGCVLAVVGVVLLLVPRIPWLGHLPGDIIVRRENFTFHFPIVTSIVVSIVLTLLLNLFLRR